MDEHPIRLVVTDDLRRSRVTVFFRLLLAIPHFVWILLWTLVAIVAVVLGWLATLATGRLPRPLHRFLCSYLRYMTHLTAYLVLVANPYPPFNGEEGVYPVDLVLPAAPERQSRWRTLLRLVLALPALLLATVVGIGASAGATRTENADGTTSGGTASAAGGLMITVAVLGWFASLVTGRMPRGLRDAGAYGTGYRAQTFAYLLLVTPRYPDSDPAAMLASLERPPEHPVHLVGDPSDLRRSRVTVLFRLPLAIPHLVWLLLWSVAALFVTIAQWFVTLFRGRPAAGLHAFLTRYVRYGFHVYAFLAVAANPFPGFSGTPGRYPLEVELPPPGRQNRWKTGFRLLLVIPAGIVNSALDAVLFVAAVLTWFASLVTGSAPWGLRNLMAYTLRYQAQTSAYLLLLTDAYPHASPLEGAAALADEPHEVAPPAEAPLATA